MEWYAKYVGIPFKSLGRTVEGSDCYGLVRLALKDKYKIELPLLLSYKDALDHVEIENIVDEAVPLLSGEKIDKAKEGSVVVMYSDSLKSHIGLMVTDTLILHTTLQTGAVIEQIAKPRIKNKIEGFYNVNKSYSTT